MKNFFYKVNDKDYEVNVIYKRIKKIYYRFKNGKFVITCSPYVLKSTLLQGLDQHAEYLIKVSTKDNGINDDSVYLFGEKYPIYPNGVFHIEGYKDIKYSSNEELLGKLKPVYLDVITKRTRYYEKLMNVSPNRITVRKMRTRHGSNSVTKKHITFAMHLMHYSIEIIDSVIVHELAHCSVQNHSKQFYDVVYKYCPEYKNYHTKLRRGEFK